MRASVLPEFCNAMLRKDVLGMGRAIGRMTATHSNFANLLPFAWAVRASSGKPTPESSIMVPEICNGVKAFGENDFAGAQAVRQQLSSITCGMNRGLAETACQKLIAGDVSLFDLPQNLLELVPARLPEGRPDVLLLGDGSADVMGLVLTMAGAKVVKTVATAGELEQAGLDFSTVDKVCIDAGRADDSLISGVLGLLSGGGCGARILVAGDGTHELSANWSYLDLGGGVVFTERFENQSLGELAERFK
jgi:hypothetical protein